MKPSFLVAFPVIRTPQEHVFYENLSTLATGFGYELEVICRRSDLALVSHVSPANIVFYDSGSSARQLVRKLLKPPSKALLHNDLLEFRFALRSYLRSIGTETLTWERSPLADYHWVEDDIFFGQSKLFDFSLDAGDKNGPAPANGVEMLASLSRDLDGARNFEVTHALRKSRLPETDEYTNDFMLFLLDNTRVTGWGRQKTSDHRSNLYPHFPGPEEALHIFSALASSRGLDFVVKAHPSDSPKFATEFMTSALSQEPLARLLPRAAGVVTGISKTAWTAAALGKPLATVGINPVQSLREEQSESASSELIVQRFAADLDQRNSLDEGTLIRGLEFASDTVWIKSDFTNHAAEKFAGWLSDGQTSGHGKGQSLPEASPEFAKDQRLVADESAAVLEFIRLQLDQTDASGKAPEPIAIDVGAHSGAVTSKARELGYKVYAFEPNPKMVSQFLGKHSTDTEVVLSRLALSSGAEEIHSFFTSPVSSGISTLTPFHDSHVEGTRVFTSSLGKFLEAWGVDHVDVLKVDTEGHDLFVLEGLDWTKHHPRAVVCEFENAKTRTLGYEANDLGNFLQSKGYSVFVSEWFPIEEYGRNHEWRRLYPLGMRSIPEDSWGNFVALSGPVDYRPFTLHFNTFVRPVKCPAPGNIAPSESSYWRFKRLLENHYPQLYQLLKLGVGGMRANHRRKSSITRY